MCMDILGISFLGVFNACLWQARHPRSGASRLPACYANKKLVPSRGLGDVVFMAGSCSWELDVSLRDCRHVNDMC